MAYKVYEMKKKSYKQQFSCLLQEGPFLCILVLI